MNLPSSPRSHCIHPLPAMPYGYNPSQQPSDQKATFTINDDWETTSPAPLSPEAKAPIHHPTCRSSKKTNRSASSSSSSSWTPLPTRLFLRTPLPHSSPTGLHRTLGPYSISIALTPIRPSIIDMAKRRIEERRRNDAESSKSHRVTAMGFEEVNVRDPAKEAVNGVFEYEHNMSEVEAPKLASLRISLSSSSTSEEKEKDILLWESAPGVNFLSAAHVELSVAEERDGRVLRCATSMRERVWKTYDMQTVDSVERGPAHAITIRGQLGSEIVGGAFEEGSAVDYTLVFRLVDHEGGGTTTLDCSSSLGVVNGCEDARNAKALAFELSVVGGERTALVPNQVHMFGVTDEDEAFFGFGHRLSNANAKGLQIEVLNQSTDLNLSVKKQKKSSSSSSCTIPQFITSRNRCLYLDNTEPSVFDLRPKDYFSIRVHSNTASGVLLGGTDMLDTLRIYTSLRGRTKMLPSWTQRNGVILGISGGTECVRATVSRLNDKSCPIAGVLVHDWSGIVDPSSTESRIWYNWIMEREHYKYWHKMVAELDAAGINLGLYLNPMIEEIPVHLRSGRRYLFGEALKQGYFVKSRHVEGKKEKSSRGNAALDGDMYQMNKRSCPRVGMLDVTSYQASQWWKKVIQTEVMDYAGASFWMADMGESAPIVNSIYHKESENGLSFHNAYSEEWARVNREAIRDAGREGDSFFLVKAGYGHTPRYAGSTTLGDQVVNYKNKDGGGLQSVLNGILNGGFSGYTFGHCAVSMAVPRTINSVDERVREMICRWMEMNAFTALFRTHDSDDGVNAVSAYNNRLLLRALAKWSAVYASLADYRMRLSSEASYRGWPIARHPILHFPNDPEFMKSSVSSFMLGESMYIAPVMRYGLTKVKVYLPQGEWTHLWSQSVVTNMNDTGVIIEVQAPVGEPPVFYRQCDEMKRFVHNLKQKGFVCPEKKRRKSRWWSRFRKS